MSAVEIIRDVMETKADVVLREMLGPKYSETTERDRALFYSGYALGHVAGRLHGFNEAQEIVLGKAT